MSNISKKKGKVKPFRDAKGRFTKRKFPKETRLEQERKELKKALPVKVKLARDELGRFVSKRVEKSGLDRPRGEGGRFRKSSKKELERENEELRTRVAELEEEKRIMLLASKKLDNLGLLFTSVSVKQLLIRHNDERFVEYIRYCRKLGMTPKQARDSWFSPRIQVAA